jgi:O-antigen/teichoic acid export membrane protein
MDLALDVIEPAAASSPPADAVDGAPAAVDMGTATALGVLSSGVSLALSIVRSKVTAIALGPAGLGKVAEVLQIVTIANLPATMITGPALVSSVADAARRGDRAEVERIARTATTVAVGASVVGGIIAVVAGYWLLPAPWGHSAWPFTILAAATALFTAWAAISQQILTAHARLTRLTIVRLLMTVSAVALLCAGTLLLGLTGQFIAMAVAAMIAVPIAGLAVRRELGFFVWPSRAVDSAFVRRALTIGATAFIAGWAQQGVLFTVRWTLIAHGGDEQNGQFQAAYAIGATYFGIVLDGIGTYVLPRYAAAQSAAELATEMEAAARFVFRMAPPAIFAAIAMRGLLVRALYSHRFDAANELVGLTMVGDMARSMAWVQASPLLYRNRIRAFAITEAFAGVMVAGGSLILVPIYGLNGVGYAYLIMWVGYVSLTAVVVAKSCDVPFVGRRLASTLALTAAAYAVLRLTALHEAVRWVVLAGVFFAWYRNGVLGSVWSRVRGKLAALSALRRKRPASPPL